MIRPLTFPDRYLPRRMAVPLVALPIKLMHAKSILRFFCVAWLGLFAADSMAAVIDPMPVDGLQSACQGFTEVDPVLDVAKKIERLARKKRSGSKIFLTRQQDYPLAWQERVVLANERKDALVVLLVEQTPSVEVAGIRLYSLLPDLAASASHVIDEDLNLVKPQKLESLALKHAADSERLQTEVEIALAKSLGEVTIRSVKGMFISLLGADTPTVMIGLGFASNKNDCKRLADDGHRAQMAEALYEAISRFDKVTKGRS